MGMSRPGRGFLAALLLPAMASATVYQGNPGNYLALLDQLQPGDTLQLAAGTYRDQLQISDLHGAPGAYITITGPQSGAAAVFLADNCCNTVQLDDVSWLEVSHLTLDGTGTEGPFGVDSRNVTHHVTISDLTIIGYGADQQMDGISTKGPAWNWIVRRNRIIGAGTGMYFGSSDGSAPFVAGLIEYNVVLDTLGYNAQIKHQNPRPSNIGMPTGVNRTIIRHNVFSKANGANGGDSARPNLLVGHLPLSGTGQDDSYEIYGNFFYQNPTEALFQGEGNIGLYGNLFVNSVGDALNIVPHNDQPRSVTVFQNTVVADGRGIYVSGGKAGFTQRIIGNAVFAAPAISGPNQASNITAAYGSANVYLKNPWGAIGQLDLYPLAGMLEGTAIDTSAFTGYTDWSLDFNGRARDQAFRGAYSGAGSNPGWKLALAMKDSAAPVTPAPTLSFSATPASITNGGSTTLAWSSTDASACTASGGWTGTRASSGSSSSGALTTTTTFSLTCSGAGGTAARSVTVTVAAAPGGGSGGGGSGGGTGGSGSSGGDPPAATGGGGGGGALDWLLGFLLAAGGWSRRRRGPGVSSPRPLSDSPWQDRA